MALGALGAVLADSGPAILIGEGSGGNMAWIAADFLPKQVRAVLAVEPDSPPFGLTSQNLHNSDRHSLPFFKLHPSVRPYGIAHIPLNFEPPPNLVTEEGGMPIPVSEVLREDRQAFSFDQDHKFPVRKLPNLQEMPHAVITTECSWNSLGAWATVKFLRGAGLQVDHLELEQFGIRGNGQLCFLELNNDESAQLLHDWIMQNVLMTLHPVQLDPVMQSRPLLESNGQGSPGQINAPLFPWSPAHVSGQHQAPQGLRADAKLSGSAFPQTPMVRHDNSHGPLQRPPEGIAAGMQLDPVGLDAPARRAASNPSQSMDSVPKDSPEQPSQGAEDRGDLPGSLADMVLSPGKTVQPSASPFEPPSSSGQSLASPIQAPDGLARPPGSPLLHPPASRPSYDSLEAGVQSPGSPPAARDSMVTTKLRKLAPAPPVPRTPTPKRRAKLATGGSSPNDASPSQALETSSRKPPPRRAATRGAKKLASVYRTYGKIPEPPIGPPPDLIMAGKRKARHEEDEDEDYKPERRRKTNKVRN